MKCRLLPHVIVLCALLLPGAAGMEVRADPAAMDNPFARSPTLADSGSIPNTANHAAGASNLYREQMDPPGSCGVPLGGPFGKNVELLLNDIQYDLDPGWYPRAGIPGANGFFQPSSDIAAAPLDTEKVVAVWREDGVAGHEGELYYSIWDASHDADAWGRMAANGPFSIAGHWDEARYYHTIHSADIDGDGLVDELLGRGASGMVAYRFNANTNTWDPVAGNGPFNGAGWDEAQYYATIHSADIDGDGLVEELLGRGASGMVAYRFDGTESWDLVAENGPFNGAGWDLEKYYATIHSADIDGDGVDELLGRGAGGMVAYRFDAEAESWYPVAGNGPFNGAGWDLEKYYATIHSADIDGDGVDELLGRGADAMEAWRFSSAHGGWGDAGWLGPAPEGSNPVLLATGGDQWEVYTRDGDGHIQYRAWLSPTQLSAWRTVTETMGVASDPVVVSRRSGNTALFYRDASNNVWFTEREGGVVWRDSPLLLTRHKVFLPIVSRASSAATGTPSEGQPSEPAALSSSAFASELSAISRNENHLAVFGVNELGQLMVKEWTPRNASDWSDTHWITLMEGVALEKPALASRHSNHLAVAVRDTSGVAYLIEWADQTGWGLPVSLGETFVGPLALAAVDPDEMFLFGQNQQSLVRSLHWTAGGGWGEPEIGVAASVENQVMPAVARRPGDVMFLTRSAAHVLWRHYTSQGRDLTEMDRDLAPPQAEFYRNQVLARVGSRSYHLAADEGTGGAWKVEGWDLNGDVWQQRLTLNDHPYAAGSPVSVAAGDLDFDGSDEIVLATYDHPTATLSVLDLVVTDPDTTPTLSIVVTATIDEAFSVAPALDLSLAIGDLDGDLCPSEVVLAATLEDPAPGDDPLQAVAKLYQFVPGAPVELQERSDGFVPIDEDSPFDGHWELEAATGRLFPNYAGEQLAVSISGEQGCPGCNWIMGFVNTYDVVTSGSYWTFTPIHHRLAVAQGDPLEFPGSPGNPYRSAVATGDLDADGYQEVAAWYLDRVFVLDLNDPGGPGDPVPGWWIEPERPLNNDQYWQSPRSLAADDLDRDGRAEIAAAAWLEHQNTGEHGFRFALLELLGDGELSPHEYGRAQPGWEGGTVLAGDVDADCLVSRLVGCNTSAEYSVVAVVNGLPRHYESGQPVFDSTGSYSVEEGGGSSESSGTTYKIGAGLTVGYEQEFNIPFVGTAASFKASVTQDFLYSSGISEEREVITAFGSNYEFDQGLGLVVYNLVDTTCYYYDVFRPDNPLETSRAMSCKPGSSDTLVMTLQQWHEQSTKDTASWSWADVGHRSRGGTLTNDLLEPGNYLPVLPVDEFLLLFEFDPQCIAPTGGAAESWHASQATGRARTHVEQFEENTTASVGAQAGGVSVEASASFGMGWDNSHTMSWSDKIAFGGGYSWAGGGYPSYWVVPYVYQATAETLAGITYPYWVMDYYVSGSCQ
jgi:hypothetical protein